jgi:hypothetical protein
MLTEALVLGRAGCEPVVALTGVAPSSVDAAPILTDPWLGLAFVLICVVSLKEQNQKESSVLYKDRILHCFSLPLSLPPASLNLFCK